MITIKLLGGAKKSFSRDTIFLKIDNITINDLLNYLLETKPKDTPELDTNNILIAVNGVDSSALKAKETKLKTGDVVSIIPVIHGGSQKNSFRILKTLVSFNQIKGNKKLDHEFLINLREKFPKLTIQGISSKYILNKSHAQKIIAISLEAKKNKTLLSEKLETDILLRFSGTTQISQAIKKTGIKNGTDFVIIALGEKIFLDKLCSELKPFLSQKSTLTNNESFLKKEFVISKKQLDCIESKTPLEDLLVEKAAVLF